MSNADWWASKLGATPQAPQYRPDPTPPMPPSAQPMPQMPPFQQVTNPAARAESASQVQSCPECGSANYMSVQNTAPDALTAAIRLSNQALGTGISQPRA